METSAFCGAVWILCGSFSARVQCWGALGFQECWGVAGKVQALRNPCPYNTPLCGLEKSREHLVIPNIFGKYSRYISLSKACYQRHRQGKGVTNTRGTAQTSHVGVLGEIPAHISPSSGVFFPPGWTSTGSTRSAWSTCQPSAARGPRRCCPAWPCLPSEPRPKRELHTHPRPADKPCRVAQRHRGMFALLRCL